MDKDSLKLTVQEYTNKSDVIWYKHSKCINITKYSKTWWNRDYQSKLAKYRMSKQIDNWKLLRNTVKKMKQLFFNNKTQEVALKNHRSWKLINLVKK